MITCKVCGGLGNQLFQIFTTIAYALKNSIPFFFLNNYQLGNGENGSTIRYTYWVTFLSSLQPFLKNMNQIPELNCVKEQTFTYNELTISPRTLLVGYFQSPKYFDDYKETIGKILKLDMKKHFVKEKYKKLNGPIIEENELISLHFRIGDYINYSHIYPILDKTYYINSLNHILNNITTNKEINVLYFCENDDLNEVEQIIDVLKDIYSIKFIRVESELEDWEQLLLMSVCKHNIIANSTFSWWGAYLNASSEKIVCYPEQWFITNANKDTRDMFLDTWTPIRL
jgi:hypothetical protein